jgi:hypothetical protein
VDGTGVYFSPQSSGFLCILSFHQCSILLSIIRGWHSALISGRSTKGLGLTPLQEQKKVIWSKERFLFLMSGPVNLSVFNYLRNARLREWFMKLLLT